MIIWTDWTGSTSLLLKEVYSLFWQISWFFLPRLFWLNQINGHSPKYSESRVSSGLYVSLCLKNVTILYSFCKQKHVGQKGPDLQFTLVGISIYDSRLTFVFLVRAEGPVYLSKLEEFLLQLCLIEYGLLLPPGVKVVISTARCNSLQKILIAIKLFYYYVSTWIFTGKNCCGQ